MTKPAKTLIFGLTIAAGIVAVGSAQARRMQSRIETGRIACLDEWERDSRREGTLEALAAKYGGKPVCDPKELSDPKQRAVSVVPAGPRDKAAVAVASRESSWSPDESVVLYRRLVVLETWLVPVAGLVAASSAVPWACVLLGRLVATSRRGHPGQYVVRYVCGIALLLNFALPPWVSTFQAPGSSQVARPAGYALIFKPPTLVRSNPREGMTIDVTRLTLQALAIAVLALVTSGWPFSRRPVPE